MPSKPLNSTAASMLGLLHQGPMTGWDLLSAAERLIGNFWSLTQSQVYRELAAMETAGLITAGTRGPRDRRPYELTDSGRGAFAEWVNREPGKEHIRIPLLLSIGFGQHINPELLAHYVAEHRARHAERLANYMNVLQNAEESGLVPDLYRRATLRFGLIYEQAVLEWFDSLPAEIRGES
ncbi:PadR family transcriptional regulator [Micromonospora sp. NPDC085948]|uniref:PadR family transcriptional regulator n=1 Tax=Micromonospora sp. NPDC085948 TaxID=3155293 RepID=UPI003436FE86